MSIKEDLERRIREYEITGSPLAELCRNVIKSMPIELLNKEIEDD